MITIEGVIIPYDVVGLNERVTRDADELASLLRRIKGRLMFSTDIRSVNFTVCRSA
jgi:hypothetical protein